MRSARAAAARSERAPRRARQDESYKLEHCLEGDRIAYVKARLAEQTGAPAHHHHLVLHGRRLADESTLAACRVKAKTRLHLTIKLTAAAARRAPPPPASAPAAGACPPSMQAVATAMAAAGACGDSDSEEVE